MEHNIGKPDKFIRLVAAAAVTTLGVYAPVGPVLKAVAFFFAATFFLTALFNYCPLYTLIGISTLKKVG